MESTFPDEKPKKASDSDLVSVQEFAEQYRVDASEVRRWVKLGYINYVLVGARQMKKVRKSDLLKPLEQETGNGGPIPAGPSSTGGTGGTGKAQAVSGNQSRTRHPQSRS